ncbi:hypothetical protein [Salirhabdus sp. Marseille-P4669]|uniref:hypothetical protein n=1 Tax=Salirhabdus sp. Marseille-P4669 TaxID=2042310 RepID=UPI000C79DF21|nr:hypothetical protein [Salirhabdus sp. Marseille-P4669]
MEIIDTEILMEDKEFNTYIVLEGFSQVTVNKTFKQSKGAIDRKKITFPVGFQQLNENGEAISDLVLLDDELVFIESGAYILFLDEISGEYHFANSNHIYKKVNKNKYENIATDSISTIMVEDLSAK